MHIIYTVVVSKVSSIITIMRQHLQRIKFRVVAWESRPYSSLILYHAYIYSLTDNWKTCCQVKLLFCSPSPHGISSCNHLIRNQAIRWAVWIPLFLLLMGNLVAVIGGLAHFRTKEEQCLQNMVLLQLFVSSVLIGIYFVITATVAITWQARE